MDNRSRHQGYETSQEVTKSLHDTMIRLNEAATPAYDAMWAFISDVAKAWKHVKEQ